MIKFTREKGSTIVQCEIHLAVDNGRLAILPWETGDTAYAEALRQMLEREYAAFCQKQRELGVKLADHGKWQEAYELGLADGAVHERRNAARRARAQARKERT